MRLTVRTKLFGGFSAVLVLTILVGVVAVTKMRSITDSAEYLGTNAVPSVELAGKVNTATSDFRIAQLGHVIADTPATMREREEQMQATGAEIDALLKRYGSMVSDAKDRELYTTVKDGWAQYVQRTDAFLPLSRRMETAKAIAILDAQNRDLFKQVSDDATAWADYNRKLSDDFTRDAQDGASAATTLTVALLIGAMLLGAAIAFLLARAITGAVGQVLRAADGLAGGDVEQDVDVRTNDELGDMAKSFGRLIAYLREMAGHADRVAQGDLTQPVTPRSERDVLGVAVRDMRDNLSTVVADISHSSQVLSAASQEMASTSEEAGRAVGEIAQAVSDVAQGAERQVRSVEQAKDATEQVTEVTRSSAESAARTVEVAEEARRVAAEGADAVVHRPRR